MRKFIPLMLLCLFCLSILSSCVSKKKFNELMLDKDTTQQLLSENRDKVSELEKSVSELEEEKSQLNETLTTETTRLTDELSSIKDDLMTTKSEVEKMEFMVATKDSQLVKVAEKMRSSFDVYSKGGFDLVNRNNVLYMNTPSPIRYRSGSTRVDKDSKGMLVMMADKLKENPQVRILVEGHTDSVPMKDGARFSSNKELSMARANRVVRELVKMGVNPAQLASAGRGDAMPIVMDESDSDETRAMNRRTEFIVLASVGDMYNLSKEMIN